MNSFQNRNSSHSERVMSIKYNFKGESMVVGLHDAEKDYLKNKSFPNLALMKISAWHKRQGDIVEWWNPLYSYDCIYSSKIFDFTPNDPYLPETAIRGGTGYRDIRYIQTVIMR